MKTIKDYIFTIILMCILCALIGCSKTIYVPVESVKTEYKTKTLTNEKYIHDSIYIHQKADTVFLEHFRTVYEDRFRIDSIIKVDTIRVPYPVEKIVYRNKIKLYQEILIYAGLCSVAILLLWFIKRRF